MSPGHALCLSVTVGGTLFLLAAGQPSCPQLDWDWAQQCSGDCVSTTNDPNPTYPPAHALDGNPGTFYHRGSRQDSYWMVDLEQTRSVAGVQIMDRGYDPQRVVYIKVMTNTDSDMGTATPCYEGVLQHDNSVHTPADILGTSTRLTSPNGYYFECDTVRQAQFVWLQSDTATYEGAWEFAEAKIYPACAECYDSALHCAPGQVCSSSNTCVDQNAAQTSNFDVDFTSATLIPSGTEGCNSLYGGCWKVDFASQPSSITLAGQTITGTVTSDLSVSPTVTTGETFYFAESDLDGHANDADTSSGSYTVSIVFTFTDTISDGTNSDSETTSFTVTLTSSSDLGVVSTAGSVSSAGLVEFAGGRVYKVEDADDTTTSNDEAYYAKLTFKTNTDATVTIDSSSLGVVAYCPAASLDQEITNCGLSASDFCNLVWGGGSQHDVNIPLGRSAPSSPTFDLIITTSDGGLDRLVISIDTTHGFVEKCTDPHSFDKDVFSLATFEITTGISATSWQQLSPLAAIDNTVVPLSGGTGSIRSESLITLAVSAQGNVAVVLKDLHVVWEAPGGSALDVTSQTWVISASGFTTAPGDQDLGCGGIIRRTGDCAVYHQGGGNNLDEAFVQDGTSANLYSYLGMASGASAEIDSLVSTFVADLNTKGATWFIDPFAKGGLAETVHIHALFEVTPTDTRRGDLPRRVMLQSSASRSDGVAGAGVHYDVTPAAFTAAVLGVSPDLITTWKFTLAVSTAEACLPVAQLMDEVLKKLRSAVVGSATALDDVNIIGLTVNKNGLLCDNSRRLMAADAAGPSVTVEALLVFTQIPGVEPSIDKSKLAASPGMLSVEQTAPSAIVRTSALEPMEPPGHDNESSSASSFSSATLVAIVAACVAAGVAAALAAVLWARRRRSTAGHHTDSEAANLTSAQVVEAKLMQLGVSTPPSTEA